MRVLRRVAICLLAALASGVTAAQAPKSLAWRALDVKAKLDATGALHIVERHAMVFTGDWNGGERTFRLFPGQQLALDGMKRIDPATGTARAVPSGSLDELDRYAFVNGTTLRWRSRLATDPAFDNTEIDYEIAYTLFGILVKHGDTFGLDHNFALPEADKPIEAFSVDLELDPVWTAPPDVAGRRTAVHLPPAADFVVKAELTRTDGRTPAGVRIGTSKVTRVVLLLVLLVGIAAIGVVFYSRESALGRFVALTRPESIDAAWLERSVFSLLPEETGALWDDKVGAPEVTAVLARLTAEQKLETTTSAKEMTLRLRVPRESFTGYEKSLIDGLFFGARAEVSTSQIRSHYKSSGFDPAAKIRPALVQKLSSHKDFQDRSTRPNRLPTLGLAAVGAALAIVPVINGAIDAGTVLGLAISTAFWWGIGLIGATFYRKRVDRLLPWMASFAFVPAVFLWGKWQAVVLGGESPLPALTGQLLLQLAVVNSLCNAARAREGPKKIARRRELAAARHFFARELKNPAPRLRDAWFPWLVAFGLGPSVDRWFRSFGAVPAAAPDRSSRVETISSTPSLGSSDTGVFTGGGGRSGGAGASASWAAAAGTLASGVSAPSSSSGGGGGESSGGSSGGGGGGGW